jgi:membrane protease subunit HflK
MPWNNGGSGDGPGGGQNTPGGGGSNNPWGNPGKGASEPPRNTRPPPRQNGPWGGGGGGGGGRGPGSGGTPPDLDELIAKLQNFLRGLLPRGFGGGGGRGRGGFSGGRGLAVIVVVLIAAWLASGFYRVQPDEQGVVLRFGAYDRTTLPGLNYHIPWPVESVLRPAVTRINRVEVGYRSQGPDLRVQTGRDLPARDVPEESLMLTGDENIIDIDCAVFWRISDASAFLFNTRNPGYTVKSAAESVLREVIGRTPIQPALTDARAQIEASVLKGVQAIVDQYGAGVEITQVQLQKVDPPAAVIDSFRDVQRANTDAERVRNEAESYRNDIVPRARGDAARLVAEADGARQASAADATGQAQRFLSVLDAYNAARDVTLRRLYIETMQDILSHTPSIIVDDKLQGIVPYLPLGDLGRTAPRPPAVPPALATPPSAGSAPSSALRITP